MLSASVIVSAAEINAATVKEIVPAPGSGNFIIPFYLQRSRLANNTAVFSGNSAILYHSNTGPTGATAQNIIPTSITSAKYRMLYFSGNAIAFNGSPSIENSSLSFKANTGITGGDGDIEITVWYTIEKFKSAV